MDVYEPTSLPLIRVRSRVTDATWQLRVAQATRDEVVIKRILAAEAKGRSLNEAIAQALPANRRSWALRRIPSYRELGFEALIDARSGASTPASRPSAKAAPSSSSCHSLAASYSPPPRPRPAESRR